MTKIDCINPPVIPAEAGIRRGDDPRWSLPSRVPLKRGIPDRVGDDIEGGGDICETRSRKTTPQQGGFILILLYIVVFALTILGGALAAHALAEIRMSQRSQAATRALYLAEAGIDQGITELEQSYSWGGGSGTLATTGNFSVVAEALSEERVRLTSQGSAVLFGSPVVRSVEAIVQKWIPPDFYENVIWASRELDFNGSAYSVTGSVRHGDADPEGIPGNVNGTITYDPQTNPLPGLSFEQLYEIAEGQGNVYDAEALGNGPGVFPTSFWYQPPTDPNDPTTGIPNINYVTTDLVLNGNIGTIGGLFVVVGNVITDPNATEDATINGNGQVAGAVYTTGDFRVNGGGQGLNVDGGVWGGGEVRLNGHATLTYNWDYMHAIEALNINASVEVVSWQDLS